ncbi:MAG: DUF4402 domain-containing protein [Bacteroidota bacterium]
MNFSLKHIIKKTQKAFVVAGLMPILLFLSIHVSAQISASANAGVKLVLPLSLTENSPMHFGTITVNGSSGTVVVNTSGVRSKTGGVTLQSIAPLMSLATYTVGGEAGRTYAINLPTTISVSNGTSSMTIGTLLAKSVSGSISHTATGTIGSGGTEQFVIGGTLNVAGGQEVGIYEGTFPLSVVYN